MSPVIIKVGKVVLNVLMFVGPMILDGINSKDRAKEMDKAAEKAVAKIMKNKRGQ